MENCLKTKLKASVDDSNLNVLGALAVHLNGALNTRFKVEYGSSRVYNSNDIIADAGVSVSFSDPSDPRVTGTGKLQIKDKYSITFIGFLDNNSTVTMELKDLEYCTNLTGISLMRPDCIEVKTLSQLAILPASLQSLIILITTDNYYNYVTGNITDVGNRFTALTTLNLQNNKSITGTMTQIAQTFPALTSLGNVLGLSGFTGDILDFVKVRRYTQSVTSGSVSIADGQYSGIKFNGNALASGTKSFTWAVNSGDNTKTDVTYNGTTVTINSSGNVV